MRGRSRAFSSSHTRERSLREIGSRRIRMRKLDNTIPDNSYFAAEGVGPPTLAVIAVVADNPPRQRRRRRIIVIASRFAAFHRSIADGSHITLLHADHHQGPSKTS